MRNRFYFHRRFLVPLKIEEAREREIVSENKDDFSSGSKWKNLEKEKSSLFSYTISCPAQNGSG